MSATPEAPARGHLPPGPRFGPLQIAAYLRDPWAYTARMRARYGDLFTMPSPNGRLVLCCTPDSARQVLAGRDEDFVVGFGVDAIRPITGEGSLLLLSGERHRRERKLLSPTFHGAQLRGYAPTMQSAANIARDRLPVGERLNLREEMEQISLEVILRAVLGARDADEVSALGVAVRRSISEVNPIPLFLPILQRRFFGFGPWARFQDQLADLDARLFALIRRARSESDGPPDVLTRLVDSRYDDGSQLDDHAIRSQLLTLLVAGHETTATALTWAFYECARSPEITGALRDEIAGLGDAPDPAEVVKLPLLEAFCKETLRLHPIVSEFFRTVREGRTFEIEGYTVPEGISLAGSILEIHRDPDLYPQPDRFRPERFLERQFAPHEFAAFGGGHRHCLGAAFAQNEMKLVVAALLPRFEFQLCDEAPPRAVFRNVTLGPKGGVPVVLALAGARRTRDAA